MKSTATNHVHTSRESSNSVCTGITDIPFAYGAFAVTLEQFNVWALNEQSDEQNFYLLASCHRNFYKFKCFRKWSIFTRSRRRQCWYYWRRRCLYSLCCCNVDEPCHHVSWVKAKPRSIPWRSILEMKYQDNQDSSDDGKGHSVLPHLVPFMLIKSQINVPLGIALGAAGGSSLDYGRSGQAALYLKISPHCDASKPITKLSTEWTVVCLKRHSIELGLHCCTSQHLRWPSNKTQIGHTAITLAWCIPRQDVFKLGASYCSKLEHESNNDVKAVPTNIDCFGTLYLQIL